MASKLLQMHIPETKSELRSAVGLDRFREAALIGARYEVDFKNSDMSFEQYMEGVNRLSNDAFRWVMAVWYDKYLKEGGQ